MLYGHNNIDGNKLKLWVEEWEKDKFLRFVKEKFGSCSDDFGQIIDKIKEFCRQIKDEAVYDLLLPLVSPIIMDCYFKNNNSSLKVANYYEVFLSPSDLETKKRIIKGYESDIKEIGKIDIIQDGTIIGNIGEKSDLMWHVFYYDFIVEENEGTTPIHAHDHENFLTLQLWNIDQIPDDHLDNYVQEILYNCSVKLGMNFRKIEVSPLYREKGEANENLLQFNYQSLEIIPLMYYNSTFDDASVRIKFLSYYQVIEYYYVRANNILLKDKLIEAQVTDSETDPREITKIVKQYLKLNKESAAIKLVLEKAIDVNELKQWLNEKPERLMYFTQNEDGLLSAFNIDLSVNDKLIISKLSDRIYSLRCSIVHSKADIDGFSFIPSLNDTNLANEIPLMSFVASRVLERWGTNTIT